jgi:PLP dependent protein
LVAVSKTKPVEAIIDAYSVGQRDFGENYVQEIVDKASDPKILENCKDIKWHFIGHLQRNKVNKIIKLPGLSMIQTIDSEKLAEAVNSSWEKNRLETDGKLKVLIQVNTSKEDEKSGVEAEKLLELYDFINEKCKSLQLEGLMTIGAYGFDYSKGPNPDFVSLMECVQLLPHPDSLQLSFGMSDDFEKAVSMEKSLIQQLIFLTCDHLVNLFRLKWAAQLFV